MGWAARLLVAVGLLLGACGSSTGQGTAVTRAEEQSSTDGFYGTALTTTLRKPSFTLPDTAGVPYDFATETEGHVTLLPSGYTYCPDICPGSTAMVGTALKSIPVNISNRVRFVFVSCDPDRDTPERLRQRLDNFGATFVGLIPDSRQAIDRIAQQALGPFWAPIINEDLGGGDYSMSPPAVIVAYTTDYLAHVLYPVGGEGERLAARPAEASTGRMDTIMRPLIAFPMFGLASAPALLEAAEGPSCL